MNTSKQTKPSIVFCHGIWADGSSFSKVIPPLQAEGYEAMAAQYGFDTPEGDVATVKRTLAGSAAQPSSSATLTVEASLRPQEPMTALPGSCTSPRLRPTPTKLRRANRRSSPSPTCSNTSKSPTGASGCVRKAPCASRETSRSKSKRLSGRPIMHRLPTCSGGTPPALRPRQREARRGGSSVNKRRPDEHRCSHDKSSRWNRGHHTG
jgi:hypothetical protein